MVIIFSDLVLSHSCTCCICQLHLCFLYCRQRSSLSCSSLSCTIMRLRLTSWLMSCRRRRVRRRGRTGSGSGSRRRSRRRRRSRARRPGNWPKWSSPSRNRSVHPLSEPSVLFVDVFSCGHEGFVCVKEFLSFYQKFDKFINSWMVILIMHAFYMHKFVTPCIPYVLIFYYMLQLTLISKCVELFKNVFDYIRRSYDTVYRTKVYKLFDFCRKLNWTKRDLCTSKPKRRPHIWSKSWMLLSKCLLYIIHFTWNDRGIMFLFHERQWNGFIKLHSRQ